MGRHRAHLRPGRPSDCDPRLRLVIADRGEHEAEVLCRVAYGAHQLAAGSCARGDCRGTAAAQLNLRRGVFRLWLVASIAWLAYWIWYYNSICGNLGGEF